jgi:hypothetical protein
MEVFLFIIITLLHVIGLIKMLPLIVPAHGFDLGKISQTLPWLLHQADHQTKNT